MTYRIKNWGKFQHYKERRPPWIKLYREILDDVEWFNLPGDASKMLIMLWLMASEADGTIPGVKQLAFRLRLTEKKVNDTLSILSHWVERVASVALAEGYQDARAETETETETETEKRTPPAFKRPFLQDVKAYCLERKNYVNPDKWFDYYEANGWRVGKNPMKDWKAAIRTWEKNEFSRSSEKKEEVPHWSEAPIPSKT